MLFDQLLSDLQAQLGQIKDHRSAINTKYSLSNVLLSAFAIFSLKDSSLFDYINQYDTRRSNLQTVYGITQCPSDSALRQILDGVKPSDLQHLLGHYVKILDDSGYLKPYELKGDQLSNHLFIPIDGVQHFCSKTVHCECCLNKVHKNGTKTYHHNALTAAIVHPDLAQVLIVASEEIKIQDGESKNDHELKAAERLLPLIKTAIGKRKAIIGGDSLFANAPYIRLLQSHHLNFLLSIKEGYQGYPFVQFINKQKEKQTIIHEYKDKKNLYRYEFVNNLYLNGQNQDLKVNFIAFTQTDLKTKETIYFTWITDIPITIQNCKTIVNIGRARWKIENETFNTLKNQGYQYEHNFGHGKKYLSQNFSQMMMLAFLFDQIQQLLDPIFKQAVLICKTKKLLWLRVKEIFDLAIVPNMNTIFKIINSKAKLSYNIII